MIAGVADTYTALWYLYDDARLSLAAGDVIDQAAIGYAGQDRGGVRRIFWGAVISRDGRIRNRLVTFSAPQGRGAPFVSDGRFYRAEARGRRSSRVR